MSQQLIYGHVINFFRHKTILFYALSNSYDNKEQETQRGLSTYVFRIPISMRTTVVIR